MHQLEKTNKHQSLLSWACMQQEDSCPPPYLGVSENCSSDGDSLALSTRELSTFITHTRIISRNGEKVNVMSVRKEINK